MSWRPPLGNLTGALIVFNAATQLWERGSAGSVILAGDVDGPADNNVVNSIQGVPVDMTGAAPSDMLIIDGVGTIVPSATPPAGVTLQAVLVNGNVTGGRNIVVTPGDEITSVDAAVGSGLAGGQLDIIGATGDGVGVGGKINIVAGQSSGNGKGGNVDLLGGPGGLTGGNGGDIFVLGGLPVDGNGGSALVGGRSAVGTNRNGGNGTFSSGGSTGSGTPGTCQLSAGQGGATSKGGTTNVLGGSGGTTSGDGGDVLVRGGGATDGRGGTVNIVGGTAATTTGANHIGAAVNLTGGIGTGTATGGTVGINGGAGGTAGPGSGGIVIITGGAGGTGGAGNSSGGSANLNGGAGRGTGTGGAVNSTAGQGGTTGTGGSTLIQGGPGGSTSGNGGGVTLRGGLPVDGNGGAVTVAGRDAATTTAANRNGGSVSITGGNGTGTGVGGDIAVTPGTSPSGINGIARFEGMVGFNEPVSPAALAAGNTNDYNPAGFPTANVLRLTGDGGGGSILTGLVPGNTNGRMVLIVVLSTAQVTLLHDDGATSTAANRFLCPNNVSLVIPPNGSRWIWYDVTSARWRVVGAVA